MVAAIAMVFVLIFCAILFFHFVQQNRVTTATQLESIARSVRQPLSAAILKANITQAETVLQRIQPAGIVSRADVVLPNQFQALRVRFMPERSVPVMITRVFELPVQISLPLYSLEKPANPQPLAYLVLQADSYQISKFIMNTLSTLVTAYFLLVLMLTVAISWGTSRLIARPLRKIARELNDLPPSTCCGHVLTLPPLHHDDEIGLLVRSYNRHQQAQQRQDDAFYWQATPFVGSMLPDKAFLSAQLEQVLLVRQSAVLLAISCETLQNATEVLKEAQREILLHTVVEKLRHFVCAPWVLVQISESEFAILATGISDAEQAISLSKQVLTLINNRLSLQGIQLRPCASIGIVLCEGERSAEQIYNQAFLAACAARRKGKNQVVLWRTDALTNPILPASQKQ